MITDSTPHYAAFISYAHADEAVAARLHKALETYPVPKHLRVEGRTTRPIFRDVAELTAAHSLSEKIRDAVNNSRVLIVLCSPAAKTSHWVNEEIKLFREIHGDGAILSALIEGTPATSFPEALIQDGREPLAASLGTSNAGFRLGVTQLAAGILGTGLDELVQRGAKRRTRRMGMGLAASLAFSAVMGFTAYQAVDARNEAELERGESEALLGYMIKDLKVKLEPVGRLELLEGVGRKAIEYYDKKNIDELSDDSLRLLAAARHVVAEVTLDAGQMEEAQKQIEAASDLTREVLMRNPDDTDAIYAHAQSEFWVGEYYRNAQKVAEMEEPWREYNRLAKVLYEINPQNFEWVMEAAWGQNNLGLWARMFATEEKAKAALENYTQSLTLFEEAMAIKPDAKLPLKETANVMAGRSYMLLALENAEVSKAYKREHLEYRKKLNDKYPEDRELKRLLCLSLIDFYIDFSLSDEAADVSKSLSLVLDELYEIVNYDLENDKNKNFFVNAVFDASHMLSEEEIHKRFSQVELLFRDKLNDGNPSQRRNEIILKVLSARISILGRPYEAAIAEIQNLNLFYEENIDVFENNWKVTYEVFSLNRDMNLSLPAKRFAEQFLTTLNKRSDLEYPTLLAKKNEAYLVLNDCINFQKGAEALRQKGYENKVKMNSIQCQKK